MNRKILRSIICLGVSLIVFCLSAQEDVVNESPILFSNTRLSALGGYHAALTDNVMTIFNNPAGFQTAEPEILLTELTLGITGPVFDIAGTILNGAFSPEDLAGVLQGLYAGLNLVGPVSLAYTGRGLSFGLFNWLDLSIEPQGVMNLNLLVTDNLLLTGGYCFRIPIRSTTLDIGLQLKALMRGRVTSYNSYLELMTVLADPFGLIMNEEFTFSMGGGLDLGLLYTLGSRFSIGVVARNLYTPTHRSTYDSLTAFLAAGEPVTGSGIVPLDLSVGIRFSPPLGIIDRYVSDFKILLDYGDILDFLTHPNTAKHWLLHLSLAMELKLLEKLALRGGFAQGLPCAGLGLDLSFMHINASMFGSELSLYPGMRPAYNLILGFEFKL